MFIDFLLLLIYIVNEIRKDREFYAGIQSKDSLGLRLESVPLTFSALEDGENPSAKYNDMAKLLRKLSAKCLTRGLFCVIRGKSSDKFVGCMYFFFLAIYLPANN